MSPNLGTAIVAVEAALRDAMTKGTPRPFVLGISGAQGSGKSTLSAALAESMRGVGVTTAVLSIDDIYHTKADRIALTRHVHPLFAVRGVPGTHDVGLGLKIIEAIDNGCAVRLPRFDKATDDRAPEADWDEAPCDTELLILEGWCLGAQPEPEEALIAPINDLERLEDSDGRWRRAVNTALGSDYQRLFGRIDMLVFLAAPGFDVVRDWRVEQEHALARTAGSDASALMSDVQVENFIRFYERLTRHMLAEMPNRADLLIRLAADRAPLSVSYHR